MFQTRLRAVLLTATALSLCTSVTYAAREEHQFDVSVTIPTFEFYAIPADPEFVLREQPMRWNLVSSTLEPPAYAVRYDQFRGRHDRPTGV